MCRYHWLPPVLLLSLLLVRVVIHPNATTTMWIIVLKCYFYHVRAFLSSSSTPTPPMNGDGAWSSSRLSLPCVCVCMCVCLIVIVNTISMVTANSACDVFVSVTVISPSAVIVDVTASPRPPLSSLMSPSPCVWHRHRHHHVHRWCYVIVFTVDATIVTHGASSMQPCGCVRVSSLLIITTQWVSNADITHRSDGDGSNDDEEGGQLTMRPAH